MNVPDATNPKWRQLIVRELSPDINFLATKVLLNRLCMKYEKDPSEERIETSVKELINLFTTNLRVPKVQNDLIKIFGKEII